MNTKSIKYRDFCCSCFRNSDAKQSVDTYLDNGEKVSHIFHVVTGIDTSKSDSADFTENMCLDCLVIVRKAFDFRQECLETQKKFARLREEEEEKAKLELLDIKEEREESDVDELETVLEVKKVADTPKCSLCNKSFTRKTTLNKHLQNVHKDFTEPDVDLSCEVCSIKFTKKSQFLDHNKEHRRSKSFICGLCEKVYETRGGWRKHQNLEHLKKKKKREKKPKKPPSNGHRPYLCSECGKSFAKRQNFQNHMTVHTGERNFPCTVCSKAFSRRGHLKKHMLIHTGERPHKCPECDSSFAHKSALVCHIRLHTGEKPYQCHLCLMRFRQYPTLKDHMSLHTGKLIECPDCGKTYSRRSFLRVHQRIHTGERPYACDRCPNRYRQKYHLDDHMAVHIGHRFHCDFCQKGYLHKWSLKKHMYNHMSEKPYTCSECGSGFVRRNRLMKHMQVSHGQKCVEITRQNQYILVQDTSEGKSRVTYKMVPVAKDS